MCRKVRAVAKERQKPLFSDMPDSKLPQVALLDGALLRQETVAPETLEMTSRMIEKRLKDFGVEVRVVLAQPGPSRLPAMKLNRPLGVKGSQIVGLAKDLARSLEPGVHPRGGDHSGQKLHGAGAAQRQAPKHPAVRDSGLAGLQRSASPC